MKQALGILASFAIVSACDVVGPNYSQPIVDVPQRFESGGSTELLTAATEQWWRRLNDPILNQLVARGGNQNLDVLTALERIRQADAALGRSGLNGQTDGSISAQVRTTGGDNGPTETNSGISANAAYVFDLYGGVRRNQEQAIANFEASQFDAGTVRLAYISDLVNSYIQARYFQEVAAITRQTITSRRATLRLVEDRRANSEATELEVQQARALLSAAEASLPFLTAQFEVNVFHMATLLGTTSSPLLAEMQHGARQPRPTGFTAVGLPADLVRNRPDVRFAERNLAATTAAIGVAEADLYPSLTINGNLTLGTQESWGFGPGFSVPVFNRGLLRANRNVAISTARQAELTWRNQIYIAIEEVQIAMTLCQNWSRQVTFLERASEQSNRVLTLSRESYEGGVITLTDVLDAERANSANRLAVADGVRNYVISWAQLQAATGKGWRIDGQVTADEIVRPVIRPDPLGTTPDPLEARLNQ